jgi:hypothetical protein
MALPVEQEKIKPSAFWYLIGSLLLAAGVVAPTILTVIGIVNAYDRLIDVDRVPIDTGGEITLEEGDYTVYVEGPGVNQFTAFSSGDVEIVGPSGEPEDLSFVSGEFTYNVNGRDGVAKLTFEAEEAGTYEINPIESASRSSNITSIVIGPGFGELLGKSLPYFLAAGLIGLVGVVLGLIILIVTGVKRGKQKRQRRLAAGGGYPPQQGFGPPPQQGYAPPPPAGYQPPPSTF